MLNKLRNELNNTVSCNNSSFSSELSDHKLESDELLSLSISSIAQLITFNTISMLSKN